LTKESKRYIAVFLLALGLRVALFLAIGSWRSDVLEKRILVGDPVSYHQIGTNIAKNRVFSTAVAPPYAPDISRTPLYPLFLGALYAISGYRPYVAILVQILVGSVTCLIVYKIGKIIFDDRAALLSGLFAAVEYSSISFSNTLFTETLFTFFFVLHFLFLVKFLKSGGTRWLVYSAVFLGLSTLTRPVSAYFFIVLIGVILVRFKKTMRKGIMISTAFTLIFLATLSPWMVRNYIASGKFLISSAQEEVIHWIFYNVSRSHKLDQTATQDKKAVADPQPKLEARTGSGKRENIRAALSDSKRYITGIVRFFLTPGSSTYPRLLGLPYREMKYGLLRRKPWEMVPLTLQHKSQLEGFIFLSSLGFLLLLYSAMIPGTRAAKRENKLTAVLLISILIYFAIASGSFTVTERYRVPIMPFVILLSCRGMVHIRDAYMDHKARKRPALTGGSWPPAD
jgi:4-amino-4-deoxy-L-arabinose transferase-like glycosyltransferase